MSDPNKKAAMLAAHLCGFLPVAVIKATITDMELVAGDMDKNGNDAAELRECISLMREGYLSWTGNRLPPR